MSDDFPVLDLPTKSSYFSLKKVALSSSIWVYKNLGKVV